MAVSNSFNCCYLLVIVLMITNTSPLEKGRQKYIYVIISCLYIEHVSNLFTNGGGGGVGGEYDPHQGFSSVIFPRGMILKRNFG